MCDDKIKLDHVQDMLTQVVHHKQLPFHAVLMDTWYAMKELMLFIDSLHKIYYCPLKDNRQVDDSGSQAPYRRVDSLAWSSQEQRHGKLIKIKAFSKDYKVKLFRIVVSIYRTAWVVTNDLTQDCLNATQEAGGMRWKIEQLPLFHLPFIATISARVNFSSDAIILSNVDPPPLPLVASYSASNRFAASTSG
jgi:hypothetical protein